MTTATATATVDWEAIARRVMHPTAVAILELLAAVADSDEPERTPRDLAGVVHKPLSLVAYHVRMLAGRGLIECVRTEPRRGALAHFYRLTPDALKEESP
jgi:DNA-binding transcriptional ArsR family regulator